MDTIFPIVIHYILLLHFCINGQEVKLMFNTSQYNGTNDYYAYIGEDIVLTCIVPSGEEQVYINRGTYSSMTNRRLVINGEESNFVKNQEDKYSFQSNNGRYQVTIYDLQISDSLSYRCRFCSWFSCSERVKIFLNVKNRSDHSQTPDFCELLNNFDGIFFSGNDLVIRCPKLSITLKASNETGTFNVDFEMNDNDGMFNFLIVKEVGISFNGTMLSCFDAQSNDVNKNYCAFLPTIFVFNEIEIVLSGGDRQIRYGTNVTLTCHSYPFLPLTIEWNELDRNVRFENVSVSEIDKGSQITFEKVEFLTLSSSSLTVICNVTIGPESNSKRVSIYPRMEDVASTQVTPPLSPDIISAQISSSTQITVSDTDKSLSPIFIVVPIIVAIGILGTIALYVVLMKLRKPISSPEVDIPIGDMNHIAVEENAYDIRDSEIKELGLSYHGSEVVENTAYVSYDGN